MQFASAISTAEDAGQALEELTEKVNRELGDIPLSLAIIFVSPHHESCFAEIGTRIRELCGVDHLIGCTARGIIGASQEIEQGPAISIWVAALPPESITVFATEYKSTPDGVTFSGWPAGLDEMSADEHGLVLFADPFSFDPHPFLERLQEDVPGLDVVGGLASGGQARGENVLYLDDDVFHEGAVGVCFCGSMKVSSVVSQGCKPIGDCLVVTETDQNVILKLGGQSALDRLQDVFSDLDSHDQEIFQKGPHLGRVVNEYQESFGRGDFLVRNIIGVDPKRRAIVIGDFVRPGQTIQFHARDSESADEDLRALMHGHQANAALLFACNGRGQHMFDEPNHDISVLQEALGTVPIAGFFASGEIGPVGNKNFLHGFTATILLFDRIP